MGNKERKGEGRREKGEEGTIRNEKCKISN